MKSKGINIKDYLSTERYTTRKELVEKTGLSDRDVRDRISELKKHRVVLYSSNKAGYKLAKELKSMTKEERAAEVEEVKHSLEYLKRTQIIQFFKVIRNLIKLQFHFQVIKVVKIPQLIIVFLMFSS